MRGVCRRRACAFILAWTLGGCEETLPGELGACEGAPVEGRCLSETELEICVVRTEGGRGLARVTETCPTDTHCVELDDDTVCAPIGDCVSGEAECDGTTLYTCVDREWQASTCETACFETGAGARCGADLPTVEWSGQVRFEERRPNDATTPTDWGDLELAPARGFLVLVLRGDEVVGASVTGTSGADAGEFRVPVPETPAAGDRVVVRAVALDERGRPALAVADPGLSAGTHSGTEPPPRPELWQWSFDLDEPPMDGETLDITEAMGSGAANMFDVLAFVLRDVRANISGAPMSVVTWFGRDVVWECGACFAPERIDAAGIGRFDSQIWYLSNADGSEWSDTVIAHEMGHWAMDAIGRSPAEGGWHDTSVPAFPGLAWSDGWATGYGCAVLGDPVYTDKQDGAFFWQNIDTYTASGGELPAPAPDAEDVMSSQSPGVLQRMSELEVSRIVWGLAGDGLRPLYDALGSARMTQPLASGFERGYQRHEYEQNADGSGYQDIVMTRDPAPMVADFLDALNCSGFSRSRLREVIEPDRRYPYPVDAPLCR